MSRLKLNQTLSLGVILLWSTTVSTPAASAENKPVQFLTGPQKGVPLQLAQSYLERNYLSLGLTDTDIDDYVISDQFVSRHNGTSHFYFQQRHNEIEMLNGIIGIHVAADGSIIHLTSSFVSDLASKIVPVERLLRPETAILEAAEHLGMLSMAREPQLLEASNSPDSLMAFDGAGFARGKIAAKKRYVRTKEGAVHLTWELEIDDTATPDHWSFNVDAGNGKILRQFNHLQHGGVPQDSYLVFPLEGEHPQDVSQTTVTGPADPGASPHGWHDSDGLAGAEFVDTRGRNVHAYEDTNGNNQPTNGHPAGTGDPLSFNYPFDPAQGPTDGTNQDAAVVNLFYWSNVMHDLTFHYGFDAAAGNFEGDDFVLAEAQDGSGTNNANFTTFPDGTSGRMQMFVWLAPPELIVNSPGSIAGSFEVASANFGPAVNSQTADLELVNDGDTSAGSVTDACEAIPGSLAGKIALIDRGGCEFGTKVVNAQNAGALGAVVVNNDGDGLTNMGPGQVGDQATIPSVFLGQSNGDTIKAELGAGVNVTLSPPTRPNRDSDMDAGVITHEYGHGISIRLTGGAANAGCLAGDEQAGEGWSDFWALVLFADPGDTRAMSRGIGNYLEFQEDGGPGIRNFPYSTDLAVNPQTYNSIDGTNIPHGVGEVWALMLWELYWNLVEKHGYDPDLYNGTGGNNLTIQLMMDGLKLQSCRPTFVDARDAILLADQNNNGGDNQCEIWRAFAKRGLGVNAVAGTLNTNDQTEDFTLPMGCEPAGIFSDGFELANTSAWSAAVP